MLGRLIDWLFDEANEPLLNLIGGLIIFLIVIGGSVALGTYLSFARHQP